MQIAEGMHEVARLEPADLRDHHGQHRVGGDVEGHAEEQIGAPLVELAGEDPFVHVELEKQMARRQFHRLDLAGVPRADDQTAAVGVAADLLDDLVDLVDGASIRRAPVAPLRTVDAAQVSIGVGPLVPDAHARFLEGTYVGFAAQKPKKFMQDGLQVQLLGGQQREAVAEAEPGLRPEDGGRSGAGPVGLVFAFFQNQTEEIEVCAHGYENEMSPNLTKPPGAKQARRSARPMSHPPAIGAKNAILDSVYQVRSIL